MAWLAPRRPARPPAPLPTSAQAPGPATGPPPGGDAGPRSRNRRSPRRSGLPGRGHEGRPSATRSRRRARWIGSRGSLVSCSWPPHHGVGASPRSACSGARTATRATDTIPTQARIDAPMTWKSPIRSGSASIRSGEGVTGPGPEEGSDQEQRQPAPGRSADQDVEGHVDDAEEQGQHRRGPEGHGTATSSGRPVPPRPEASRCAGRRSSADTVDTTGVAVRAIRPPPRQASPS